MGLEPTTAWTTIGTRAEAEAPKTGMFAGDRRLRCRWLVPRFGAIRGDLGSRNDATAHSRPARIGTPNAPV